MRFDQRVLHGAVDISERVNDFRSGVYTFPYQSGEYLYVGSITPFNNLYVELGVVNDVATTPTVEVWWGRQWRPVVDLYDGTGGLFQNGRLVWNIEIDQGWDSERESEDITGLSGTKIYHMYWLRLSWSNTIKATTTLRYLGQKFSNDDVLASYYPDLTLSSIKEQFETGKTTWDEQHYMAAELIIMDLKKRGIIVSRGQILDYSDFEQPACHKLAEIVYTAFGPSYFEQRAEAAKYYDKTLPIPRAKIDANMDGRLDAVERVISTRFMTR